MHFRLHIISIISGLMILLPYASCAWAGDFSRIRNFDKGWKFSLGSPDAESRTVDLPHDWAIEGDFSKDNPSGTGGGALPGGTGWYSKTFTLPASDAGKQVYIDFDGAYMNSTVSINGHVLGTRPYGYASFSYDLTPWLRKGENLIEVKVDNAEQPNSRWYSGCGIYRHVRLRVVDPVHIAQWGVFVRQDSVSAARAALTIETKVEN
ncbi:MAG: glycoside hydrolase family 2, partial [Muribaculaceae bacterium]|nr:glycoside hydrolase family 2 [Muribaculaceae bacterium]